VADTAPITCSASSILAAPTVTPADRAEFERTRKAREAVAQSCRTEPASLLEHLDTHSSARDAEAFRRAAGVGPVIVGGTSYGTLLGARYLELFGDQARGAIFDGVMDPNLTGPEFQRTAAQGLQNLFDEFARWCAGDRSCALRGRDVSKVFAQARRQGAEGAIPGTTMMGVAFDEAGVVQAFELTAGQNDFAGAATAIKAMARGKNPNPSEPDAGDAAADPGDSDDRFPYAGRALCADFDLGISDLETARTTATAARRRDIPFSTNAYSLTVHCAGTPRPSTAASAGAGARGDFPILLLSHRYDAATPIAWANAVAGRLGGRARHLVAEGVGHGDATSDPSIRSAVLAYLAVRGA